MGCCCSLLGGGSNAKESEMTTKVSVPKGKSMTLSRKMSSPTIELEKGSMKVRIRPCTLRWLCSYYIKRRQRHLLTELSSPHAKSQLSGNGLALAGVCIEQDAAYWEWHMVLPDGKSEDTMFGISTSKDRKFYRGLEELEDRTYIAHIYLSYMHVFVFA